MNHGSQCRLPCAPLVLTIDEKDLMVSDIMTRETGAWNKEAVEKHLPHLVEEILLLQPSMMGAEDKYAWLLNSSGEYSSKSGYLALQLKDATPTRANSLPDDFSWYKSVWNPPLLPKIQLFLWKVLYDAIPTGANLQKRGVLANTNCVRCGSQETTLHLFFHCDYAKQVWALAPWSSTLDASTASSLGLELQLSQLRINLPPVGVSSNIFPWIIWALWTAQNLLLFEKRTSTPVATMTKAISAAREWSIAQSASPPPTSRSLTSLHPARSIHPPSVLCFTDASWISSTKHAGLAWIFTDSAGKEINRGSLCRDHISSPLLAEGMAVRASLLHAVSLGITNI